MTEHTCDPETCGEEPCYIGSSGWPVRDASANGIDGEAPCECEAHDA